MSDIAERLRMRLVANWVHGPGDTPRMNGHKVDPDCHEAADEIERLRAKLTAEKAEVFRLQASHSLLYNELAAAKADVQRYRWLREHKDAITCWDGGDVLERDALDDAIDFARFRLAMNGTPHE